MARYVIDAPTLLHVVTEEVPIDDAHQLVAPNAIRSHALALLLDAVRAGDITEAIALDRHDRLTALKMRLLGDRVSRRTAWRLARQHDWPIADAEYVAVTQLQADAFISVDTAAARRAAEVVTVAPFAALSSP